MSDIQLFQFKQTEVRIVMIDNEPWFVAKDLCDVLELKDVSMSLKRLDSDEKGTNNICTPGGKQDMAVVSESGMYTLVLLSRKPEAKPFRKWITSEVLPAIRKTGKYEVNNSTRLQPGPTQPVNLLPTGDSVKDVTLCIRQFEESGDIQLAQVLKSYLGNFILQGTQQFNQQNPVCKVQQYEGAVDVAIRLGFSVPKKYESTLGKFVKKQCSDLIIGKNQRYSTASHKQVPANMYPANNERVETAVREFCLSKSLTQKATYALSR